MLSKLLKQKKLWIASLLLGATLIGYGCSSESSESSDKDDANEVSIIDKDTSNEQEPVVNEFVNNRFRVSLRQFDSKVLDGYQSCSDLAADIEEAGQHLVNLTIDQQTNWDDWPLLDGVYLESDVRDEAAAPTAPEPVDKTENSQESGAGDGESGYKTNVQVEGVDEADIVKSDGEFIYIAYGKELLVHDLNGNILDRQTLSNAENDNSSGNKRAIIGIPWFRPELVIEDLLLTDSRVVVLSSGYDQSSNVLFNQYTRISLFDVDNEGQLTLVDDQITNGRYQSARELNGNVHIVTITEMSHWQLIEELYRYREEFKNMNDEEYQEAALAKAQTILPEWRDEVLSKLLETEIDNIPDSACRHIVQVSSMQQGNDSDEDVPDLTNGQGVLSSFTQILSVDVSEGLSNTHKAGAFSPNYDTIVYANQDIMVIGGQGWSFFDYGEWESSTFLMAFALNEAQALPVSVGVVEGRILNQFSMDVYEDHLRVASTIDARWSPTAKGPWEMVSTSESLITVLKTENEQMEKVGEVRGLGKGENIYATRFLGNKGFVVTFKQMDPFYTIDLSDPTNPQIAGELKIPGYSNYLHPLGDDHILAIGQDADEKGIVSGLQVAVFDVSNLANPAQIHKHVVEGWSSSSAQFDHHAFRYLPSRETLILPLSSHSKESFFDGFELYNISSDEGISPLGRIEHRYQSEYGKFRDGIVEDTTEEKGRNERKILAEKIDTSEELPLIAPPPEESLDTKIDDSIKITITSEEANIDPDEETIIPKELPAKDPAHEEPLHDTTDGTVKITITSEEEEVDTDIVIAPNPNSDEPDIMAPVYCPMPLVSLPPRSMVFGDQLITMKGNRALSHDINTLDKQWESVLEEDNEGNRCNMVLFE